jgi:ABC-type transport system involved in cytochrome bd biosynthesis fused ATPase/permease subunit
MTIAVAHRLSTLRAAGRILVLEDGRVAGLGTHNELLAGCAVYRRLWEAQATGALVAAGATVDRASTSGDAKRIAGR